MKVHLRILTAAVLLVMMCACSDHDDNNATPVPTPERYAHVGTITDEYDREVEIEYEGKNFFPNTIHQINFTYPSLDPDGQPVTLSGAIRIPKRLLNGTAECEGIILYHHYTTTCAAEVPTRDYAYYDALFLIPQFELNYVLVESDFYGFGVTVDKPQAFQQGTVNARASIDALLAAEHLLKQRNFPVGPYRFNVGYSSGGYDALAAQKLRDMEYRDLVSFDKTFAGGGSYDLARAYREYIKADATAYNVVLPLLMYTTNETLHLGLDYHDIFQPIIADNIDEWIVSKKYTTTEINDAIGRSTPLHDLFQPPYMDLESPESRRVLEVLGRFNIANDWTPDPTQHIFIFHAREDDYVPISSALPIVNFLTSHGFKESQHAGESNLQTNFKVQGIPHLAAVFLFTAQTIASIKSWAAMYRDGQLDAEYAAMLESGEYDLVAVLRLLEARGVDIRTMLKAFAGAVGEVTGEGDGEMTMEKMQTILSLAGIEMADVVATCVALGYNPLALMEDLQAWFNETAATQRNERAILQIFKQEGLPVGE